MIPVENLTSEQRERLRTGYRERMEHADHPEWRELWATEVLFVDGQDEDAIARLQRLAGARTPEVARTALLSLGQWYERAGSPALACEAYTRAIDHARDIPSGVPARTNLARLHNAAGEALQALAVLAGTIEDLERVAPDSVQFVIVEFCRALLTLGRVDDARLILRRALAAFPHRVELARLEDHFVGSR